MTGPVTLRTTRATSGTRAARRRQAGAGLRCSSATAARWCCQGCSRGPGSWLRAQRNCARGWRPSPGTEAL